ncbi:MAG TPA: CBS domain-containing protein [Xanthobacteraceae bacterium]|jgi:CBS domain-containing protein|nr:CBS domain-containing protein [Xanthobacteraceae bacterium]
MKAGDVMTRHVVSIGPEASVLEAAQLMLQNRISGLPVVDRTGNLVGMVTEGDFLRRAELGTERKRPRWLEFLIGPRNLAQDYVHSHGRKIETVMTPDPITVTPDTPLDEIVRTMERRQIKRLPVVSDGKVVGIVSRANLLHALASLGQAIPAAGKADGDIRERILADLQKQSWAPLALIDVIVRNGEVDLWGTITDEKQGEALRVCAENVPGVKAVRTHLTWIEPVSGMVIESPDNEPQQVSGSAR